MCQEVVCGQLRNRYNFLYQPLTPAPPRCVVLFASEEQHLEIIFQSSKMVLNFAHWIPLGRFNIH